MKLPHDLLPHGGKKRGGGEKKLPHDLLPHGGKKRGGGKKEGLQWQKGFIDISLKLYNDI